MPAPYNQLRSKLDRAIVAWLVQQNAGGLADTFPANSLTQLPNISTVVRSTFSKPEVPLTGLRRITVHVRIRSTAVNATNEPNPEVARVNFDKRVETVADSLMQTADGETLRATAQGITAAGRAMAVAQGGSQAAIQFAANNADMADFTCNGWYDAGEGDGEPDEIGAAFDQVLVFEAICSASNVD